MLCGGFTIRGRPFVTGNERPAAREADYGLVTCRRPNSLSLPPFGTVTTTSSMPVAGELGVTATMPTVPLAGIATSVQPVRSVPYWNTWVVSDADSCRRWKVNTRFAPELSWVGRMAAGDSPFSGSPLRTYSIRLVMPLLLGSCSG